MRSGHKWSLEREKKVAGILMVAVTLALLLVTAACDDEPDAQEEGDVGPGEEDTATGDPNEGGPAQPGEPGEPEEDTEWTVVTQAVIRDIAFNALAIGPSALVLVGEDLNIRVSKDVATWEARQVSGAGNLTVAAWGEPGFLVAGQAGFRNDDALLFTSSDGDEWERITPVLVAADEGNEEALFTGDAPRELLWHDGHFYMMFSSGRVYRSEDAAVWELVSNEEQLAGNRMLVADGEIVIIGNYADVMYRSQDGVNWSESPITGDWGEDSTTPYGYMMDATWDGSRFVAVSGRRILISQNGTHWEALLMEDDDLHSWDQFTSISYGNGIYLLVGGNTQLPRDIIGRSDDGVNWNFEVKEPGTIQARKVRYDGSAFISFGHRYHTGRSQTGAQWDALRFNLTGTISGILYDGSRFVAYGEGRGIITSEDTVNWNLHEFGFDGGMSINSGLWDGEEFILLASVQDGGDTVRGALLRSPDGVVWEEREFNNMFQILAWDGETYILKGPFHSTVLYLTTDFEEFTELETGHNFRVMYIDQGRYLAVTTSSIFYSEELGNWEEVHSGREWIRGLASGEGGFVAVGEQGIILSTDDGRDWNRRESPVSEEWISEHTSMDLNYRGVAWDGERYLAVGGLGRIIKSSDGEHWRISETGRFGVNDWLTSVAGDASRNLNVAAGVFLTHRKQGL